MAGRISEYIDAPKLVGTELMDLSVVDGGSPSGYVTRKVTIDDFLTDFPNLYSNSGTLGGNRTVNQSGNTLYFNSGDWGVDFSNNGIMYDDLTKRVGFGESTQLAKVHIKGGIGDDLFLVEDSVGGDAFFIDDNKTVFIEGQQFADFNSGGGRFDMGDTIRPFYFNTPTFRVSGLISTNNIRSNNTAGTNINLGTSKIEYTGDVVSSPQLHHKFTTDGITQNDSTIVTINNDSTQLFYVMGDGRINMSSLPTSTTGLVAGDLWNNAGVINIV